MEFSCCLLVSVCSMCLCDGAGSYTHHTHLFFFFFVHHTVRGFLMEFSCCLLVSVCSVCLCDGAGSYTHHTHLFFFFFVHHTVRGVLMEFSLLFACVSLCVLCVCVTEQDPTLTTVICSFFLYSPRCAEGFLMEFSCCLPASLSLSLSVFCVSV
ncbi:unnamed protein product [Discosporangium mesarthrocarpum]